MRAPSRSIEDGKLLPFCEVKDGRKIFRQIDDELLGAFEADVQSDAVMLANTIGMICARVREAEKDRDDAERIADQMGHSCDLFKAHILKVEEERDVAQRGCQTLSAQLEEANKEILRLRGVNDKLLKDLGG